MTHLNDEQFEQAMESDADFRPHLAACEPCRQRLAEMQALRQRLRGAFESVHAPAALRERLAAAAREHRAPAAAPQSRPRSRVLRYAWPLAAAAMALIVALPLYNLLLSPQEANADQQALVDIHRQNLADGAHFYSEDEPAKLAAYLKEQLGFSPALPKLNQGMAIRGCCLARFRGGIVGSYVVGTPSGPISVIVVKDAPARLGLRQDASVSGRPAWTGHMTRCSIAALQIGELSYIGVGEVPADRLLTLLALLLPTAP